MNESPIARRLRAVEGILGACFLLLALRLLFLHTRPDPDRVKQAEASSRFVRLQPAPRGRIYDGSRTPVLLAASVPRRDLCADPLILHLRTNQAAVVALAASFLGLSPHRLDERLSDPSNRFVYIQRHLPEEVAEPLWTAITNAGLHRGGGLYFRPSTFRQYPHKDHLCHVIGFASRDVEERGLMGLELAFDRWLRGRPGLIRGRRGAFWKELYTRREDEHPPVPGADVYLTIDRTIQHFAEEALDEAMATHRAKGAWAIVQRCQTGEILAMASRPAFDLNRFPESTADQRTNRAVSIVYEPGSIFKPVVLALAFERKLVEPSQVFDTENGSWLHEGRILRDYHPYPRLSVADILKKSSNIGTAKISLLLGNDYFYEGARRFGYGRRLGIELPNEEAGLLWSPRSPNWSRLTCSRMAIGQGVAVTALQMAGMMSAIANGGYLLRPWLVRKVVAPDGTVLKQGEPEVLARPISSETAALMRYLLARVTEEGGTGTRARLEGYRVAGKTGTAQKVVGGRYSETDYVASFAGFFPADQPELTIVVGVDEPQPYHTGGVVAAPIFARIAQQTARYLALPPSPSSLEPETERRP
jgi:cell division protein FtsI/penicillin-binding protein 2